MLLCVIPKCLRMPASRRKNGLGVPSRPGMPFSSLTAMRSNSMCASSAVFCVMCPSLTRYLTHSGGSSAYTLALRLGRV